MKTVDELIATIEGLMKSGADQEHDANDMLALLEGIDYWDLLNVLIDEATPLFSYSVDCIAPYRAKLLTEHRAVRLYERVFSEDFTFEKNGPRYQRSNELWLLSDMSLLVTSCFRASIPGVLLSEYRTVKGTSWKDAGMHIDFVDLADNLLEYADQFLSDSMPVYEL